MFRRQYYSPWLCKESSSCIATRQCLSGTIHVYMSPPGCPIHATMSIQSYKESLNNQVIQVSATSEVTLLPPLTSPAVLASENPTFIAWRRHDLRSKLQRRWPCNWPGHGVCLHEADTDEHFPLSKRQIEIWVSQLVSDRNYTYTIQSSDTCISSVTGKQL